MSSSHYFAVIPAAGSGSRFGASMPKQYLSLNGFPLIRHTISALLSEKKITRVVVVVSPDDDWWNIGCIPEGDESSRVQVIRLGGITRAETVLNGINWLKTQLNAKSTDWVLVHDAARPCISSVLIECLIRNLEGDSVGGLLAVPVADTLKKSDNSGSVQSTIDRAHLWQAQTPQMFRLGLLFQALQSIDLAAATDESAAIEALGYKPKLIPGSLSNLKVTYPADMLLAEAILNGQSISL